MEGPMKNWAIRTMVLSLSMFSLHSSEEQAVISEEAKTDKKEVVEVGKQPPQGSAEGSVKRRWTKRTKPGAPKARKATPSRKKVATLEEQKIISMDEEELDEESDYLNHP
jgi:hypothetical protein